MTSRCFHRREVTFLDTTGGWLNCAICHKSVDRLTGRIVPGGCRTVRPCTVAARITKTARTAGREPSPKWRSRLSDGKFSFSTARLGKTPGLGRWHAWGPGKTSSFDSRNFFVFSQEKHLTFSVLFSIVFHNAICGKIHGCGSLRTAAISRPQSRAGQTAEDCGGSGVFFRKPLSPRGVD